MMLIIVYGHEYDTVLGQQFLEQLQPGPHHATPHGVALHVVGADHAAQPLLQYGTAHVIVVYPALAAGVVRRVDVYAVDASGVARQ